MPLVRPPIPALDWAHPEALPLEVAEAAFFAEKTRVKSENTARGYRSAFAAFRDFLARHHVEYCAAPGCDLPHPAVVAVLSPELLTAYTDWLQVREPLDPGRVRFAGARMAPATVSGYLRPLRTLFKYFVLRHGLAACPFDLTVDPLIPTVEETPAKTASVEDFVHVLDGIVGDRPMALRDRAIVALDGDTGMRTAELARLQVSHVELVASRLVIKGPKNRRDRIIALNPPAVACLAHYLAEGRPALAAGHARHGRPDLGALFLSDPRPHGGRAPLPGGALGGDGMYQMLGRRWRGAGGAGRFGFHRFRHMVGTQVGQHGTVADVMERLNHKSPRSAVRYMHPTPEHVASLVGQSIWASADARHAARGGADLRLVGPACEGADPGRAA